jgi:hypothetical protein
LVCKSADVNYAGHPTPDSLLLVVLLSTAQDGNTADWSAAELSNILAIWRAVAEDYAPFDVDVTTEEPVGVALANWVRCVVGGDGACEYQLC